MHYTGRLTSCIKFKNATAEMGKQKCVQFDTVLHLFIKWT